MYISSSPNVVGDGYTPNNNGTIYPWIESEAQVKLKLLSSAKNKNSQCLIMCALN